MKVLDGAINDANRRNKREKFCAETSEDAVTWTVFRWLHQAGHAALVPSLCGLAPPEGATSLLLWGAPAGGEEADLVRERYEQVSDCAGREATAEDGDRRASRMGRSAGRDRGEVQERE